eukprot:m.89621 g.89621  ORF g.89621 m.89621 type:complete len:131 (+) comp18126_c4_seq1:322-714(+)
MSPPVKIVSFFFSVDWRSLSLLGQQSKLWREKPIRDDPVKGSNKKGTITFASAGPNTRTTQLFINLGDNSQLDKMGFSPLGQCVAGCHVLDQLYMEYAEMPKQGEIQSEGNKYLKGHFEKLDYITSAKLV